MAHIDTIGASLFSDLSVINFTDVTTPSPTTLGALSSLAGFSPYFATESELTNITAIGSFCRIKNVREFPALGTPPNIVNVPGYGSKTSQQIQGQSDAPSLEITVNYIADQWSDTSILGSMVGDGVLRLFRFALLNAEPTASGATTYASITGAAGLSSVKNSQYFWLGKIEALQVNPQLTDATTATVTMSIQSKFFGAFTQT